MSEVPSGSWDSPQQENLARSAGRKRRIPGETDSYLPGAPVPSEDDDESAGPDPADVHTWYTTGMELLAKGSPAAAAHVLQRAVIAEPGSRSVRDALAPSQFDTGQDAASDTGQDGDQGPGQGAEDPAEKLGSGRIVDLPAGQSESGTADGTPDPQDRTEGDRQARTERFVAGLLRLHAERMQVVARERRTRERFVSVHPEVPMVDVTALPGDVHDLDGLRAIGLRLAGEPTAA